MITNEHIKLPEYRDEGPFDGHEEQIDDHEVQTKPTNNLRKWLFGLVIVIGIALSWVAATQFAQSTFSANFFASSFIVWFSTTWIFVCYPVYILGAVVIKPDSRSRNGIVALHREAELVFGRKGLNLVAFFKLSGSFCCCWVVTNYLYAYALGLIAAADVTALFASNTAFIYAFSWIWLHERIQFLPARGTSVILSIVGIVLMAFADGFTGPTAAGVLLSVGAAIGSALYKVLYKKYIGDATYGEVSLFLTVLSLFNIVFMWPFVVVFYFSGFEVIEWDKIPWNFLCGKATLGLVFNFLINFGIALTFPLFIALGTVLGIPLNAVVDLVFRGIAFGAFKIAGTMCIVFGFLIMLMPDQWQKLCWPKICPRGEQSQLVDEPDSHTVRSTSKENEEL